MKKLISTLLVLVTVISSFTVSFTALAADKQESDSINSFINGTTELAREYDADKEFIVPENDESNQIQSFSAENTTDKTDNNAKQ